MFPKSGSPTNHYSTAVVLVALLALVVGGGTHAGFLGDAILQAVSVVFLGCVIWAMNGSPAGFQRGEIALMAAILAVPLIQIIPLPPAIWKDLPLSDMRLEAFAITGAPIDWRPATIIPEATILGALSLIPPFAVFLGVRSLDYVGRRRVVIAVLSFSALSVFLGLAQVAGGEQSPLRFYEVTNPTEAVGFFANRNHLAALLYIALMFAAAFAVDSGITFLDARRRHAPEPRAIVIFTASVTLMFLLAVAQIMARSRAGVGLTMLGSLGIATLVLTDSRNFWRAASLKLLAVAIVAVLLFSAQFGITRFVARLGADVVQDDRLIIATHTLEAIKAYFPFGTGVGTFKDVYPLRELPAELLSYIYVNHAHDDFLELFLESGVAGVALLVCCLAWLAVRGRDIWRKRLRGGAPIDLLLRRASLFALVLLLLHSTIDYPLRTSAIMVLTAICCALLTRPHGAPSRMHADAPRRAFVSFPSPPAPGDRAIQPR